MTDWSLIFGMALLTFAPRYLPFGLAGRVTIPPLIESALNYVPVAVLSAIVIQNSLIRDGAIEFNLYNHHLIATITALIAALLSRHLLITIAVGLISYGVARFFI